MTAESAFVGRAAELAQLDAALAAARAGRSQIVLIEGEAGIGKTALLRRCLGDAPDITVAWASGDPAESGLQFGMIGQWLADLPGLVRAEKGWGALAAGAALLAGVSAAEEGGPALALVADDLHWADSPSADALLFCLRRLSADPVLVLLTVRPAELDRLGESWTRLLGDPGRVGRIRLAGLSTAEVRTLAVTAGRDLTAEAATRLRQHAGGNPLYLSALLTELPDDALRDPAEFLPAPRAYAAAVLARLAGLAPPARDLVRAAAVAGVRCRFRLAAAMAAIADETAALDAAVAAGLLDMRLGAGEDELAFTHPLAQAAVYDDLSPSQRRRLHQAAARLLPPPASYGHRMAAAAGGFDRELATDLITAADEAETAGALQLAARYLGWAVRVDPDPDREEQSLLGAIRLTLTSGDVQGAIGYAEAVAARPDSPWRRFTLLQLAVARGDLEHAVTGFYALAEEASPDRDATLFAHLTAVLAMLCAAFGRDDEARLWAQRSLATSTGLSPSANIHAVQALAWSYAKTGQFRETFRLLADSSLGSLTGAGPFRAELLTIQGAARNWAGDLPGAIEDLTAAVNRQRSGPFTYGITNAYAALAEAEFRSGDWDAAVTHLEVAISLGQDLGHPMFLAYAHCVAAYLAVLREGEPAARAHLAAARAAAASSPSLESIGYAALAGAHVAWARSDWIEVSAVLRPLADGDSGTAVHYPNLGLWRCRLAEACIAEGRLTEAGRLLDEAPPPPWAGITHADLTRLQALIWHRKGDSEKAVAAFAAAMPAAGSRSLGDGLLALDYGRLLVQLRKRKAAVPALLAGRAMLAGLGAVRLVGECDRALLAAGVPAPASSDRLEGEGQPPTARLSALTGREQAVARLAAAGLTNRQVAAELYVSVKAVEYHLTSVFAKLGVNSRRQLPDVLS